MTLISQQSAPPYAADGTTITGYAAPSRGASQISLWRIELAPAASSPLHQMDVEEVFLGLEGEAVAVIDIEQLKVVASIPVGKSPHGVFMLKPGAVVPANGPIRAVSATGGSK